MTSSNILGFLLEDLFDFAKRYNFFMISFWRYNEKSYSNKNLVQYVHTDTVRPS